MEESNHRRGWIPLLGPILLFIGCTAYGLLEAHPANDTWIGLAAGRQILTSDEFPLTDTFSYTVNGQTWYNQNWLTHTFQYWLYDAISPDAVIYVTWLLAAGIFVMIMLAVYYKTKNPPAALIAAAVVALGCRDFLSARPATTGFFCLAVLWALICYLEGQSGRHRSWPILLLLPLLTFWGCAHGSFVLGYGILALYVAHWLILRCLKKHTAADGVQIILVTTTVLIAIILTIAFGPFGIHNFLHGEKVAGSAVWRDVAEWQPPYVSGHNFPPVWRFWTILAAATTVVITSFFIKIYTHSSVQPQSSDYKIRTNWFDAALVLIGLAMTLWARRFAPIFLIFAAPVIMTWIMILTVYISNSWKTRLRAAFSIASLCCACLVGYTTASKAYADLIKPYRDHPEYGLLERITSYDTMPHEAFIFINDNQLRMNMFAEWSIAGAAMLHAPGAKVFIDGRAQQVYTEELYLQYHSLFVAAKTPHELIFNILNQSGTDAVLIRHWQRGENLWAALENNPLWLPVLPAAGYRLYLRSGSEPLQHLNSLLCENRARWPESSYSLAGQGFVWLTGENPQPRRAIETWKRALQKNFALGVLCIRPLIKTLLDGGRDGEARLLLTQYTQQLEQPFLKLSDEQREKISAAIETANQEILKATSGLE